MGSTRNNGRLVAGARFSAINNTGERGPADSRKVSPCGSSWLSLLLFIHCTDLRLRRGRFFLNEVTKLIFPLLSETIASSSLSLSLSFLHSSLRPCKPLPLYVSALSAIIYPPHYAYFAIIARAELCGCEARLMVGRSFWFMDGKSFLRKMYFLLLINVEKVY